MFLQGKKIVLGITAGIALYKMCDFIRRLRKEGAEVRVIVTEHAAKLVSEQVFYAVGGEVLAIRNIQGQIPDQERPSGFLSGMTGRGSRRVLFLSGMTLAFPHLDVLQGADFFLVAPATANILGKAANGIADDLLSTALLAAYGMPVYFAPAMNTRMWKNPIVQANCLKLRDIGYHILDPEKGELACGELGEGRMASLDRLFHAVIRGVTLQDFVGKKVLITAGPTLEPFDPVRFLSNYSSGKMGYFLAQNAWHRGASVTLVSGRVSSDVSALVKGVPEINIVSTQTSSEMYEATKRFFSSCDVCVFSAAVTDFQPVSPSRSKIKKSAAFRPVFEKTRDIALELSRSRTHQKVVGFALETDNMRRNAREKLQKKCFDMIVVNTPETFGKDDIRCSFVTLKKKMPFRRYSKYEAASKIFDFVVK